MSHKLERPANAVLNTSGLRAVLDATGVQIAFPCNAFHFIIKHDTVRTAMDAKFTADTCAFTNYDNSIFNVIEL